MGQVVDSPEVLSAIKELPHLPELLDGLYNCNYSKFFHAMGAFAFSPRPFRALIPLRLFTVEIHPTLTLDRYFAPHVRYIIREFIVLAYAQFLEAYKRHVPWALPPHPSSHIRLFLSVTLGAMAKSFGVGIDFCDK